GTDPVRFAHDREGSGGELPRDAAEGPCRLQRRRRGLHAACGRGREAARPGALRRRPAVSPLSRHPRAEEEPGNPGRRVRTAVGATPIASRPGAGRRGRLEDRGAAPADRAVPVEGQDPPARLRDARHGRRALPRRGSFRLPVARGGLRPPGGRGDGLRPARRRLHRRCPRGGGRGPRPHRRPGRPGRARGRHRDGARRRAYARATARRRPRSSGALLVGCRRRRDRGRSRRGRGGGRVTRGRPPLVGIDARKVGDCGIGSHIRSLLEAMAARPESERFRFRIYLRGEDREVLPAMPAQFEAVEESARGYSLAEMTGFAWRLFRDRLDLFHATHYVLPPLLPSRAGVPIPDITPLLYPQFRPSRAAHVYARFMIHRALTRADRIITVSYNSKRDLIDYFGIPAARTEVIYNGVSSRFRSDPSPEQR